MTDEEDRLREIRQRISNVANKRARAEVEKEQALDRTRKAKNVLLNDFGVKTTADAKAKREQLAADYEDAISTAEAALSEAGA